MYQPPYPDAFVNWHEWAVMLVDYINQKDSQYELFPKPVKLQTRVPDSKAFEDGIIMYDTSVGLPVFSKNGNWYDFAGNLVP